MMHRSIKITAALTLFLAAGAVSAEPTQAAAKRLLPAEALDVTAVLPDPAPKGSPQERAELDAVLAAQQTRTPADVARAKAEEKFDVFVFSDVMGAGFTADSCPKTATLFKSLAADGKAFAKAGKEHWNRRRPPFVDDRIKPAVLLEDEGAYPSSHAVRGQLFGEVLAMAMPNNRSALLARGQQIGFDRILGGVHYPSDIYAGQVLGHAIFQKLQSDSAFAAQLAEVRAELQQLGQNKVSSR